MKTLGKIIAAATLTLICGAAHAQQDPMYTHYMYNTLSVNPGYAGSRDALTVTGLHRSQWVGFAGAPLVQTITMHTPFISEKVGVGLSVLNDKIGPTNNTSIFAQFAYRINLTKKSKLAFGVSGGINLFQAKVSLLDLDVQNDPLFQNNISNRISPNFGFGLYYSRECFYAGLSAPNLLQNNYAAITLADGTTSIGKEQRHYFFIAGAVLKISDNLAFKPTTLVKVTQAVPVQADLTASFLIMKKLLLGAMFRTGDAVGALVGFDITNQFHLGYSFDFSYGLKTPRYNQGSHEILVRYDFIFASRKQVHSPRYF